MATPARAGDEGAFYPGELVSWLSVVVGRDGREHAVLSDGLHHIRFDLEEGTLRQSGPIMLQFRLHGSRQAEDQIVPLQRFLHLCRHHSFSRSLFPHDWRVRRGVVLLQVHDALEAGASQREIAGVLVGESRAEHEWLHGAGSLRSRVRRLVNGAKSMAAGQYQSLMNRQGPRI